MDNIWLLLTPVFDQPSQHLNGITVTISTVYLFAVNAAEQLHELHFVNVFIYSQAAFSQIFMLNLLNS